MAQSDGNGICGIVRLWHFLQMQKPFGHILHLMLGSIAIAHHCLLDLHWLVGKYGYACLPDGKEDHTAALSNTDAGGHILTEKQFFNGNGFWL